MYKETVVKTPVDVEYTFYVSISRKWLTQRWFDRFNNIVFPSGTELVFIYDSSDVRYSNAIIKRLGKWLDKFVGIRFYFTNRGVAKESMAVQRRSNIKENMEFALSVANGKVFLCSEDDVFPFDDDVFLKLVHRLNSIDDASYIQGIGVSRHGDKKYIMCFDAKLDNDGEVIEFSTCDRESGFRKCFATTWSLFVGYTDVLKEIRPRDDSFASSGKFGPDVLHSGASDIFGYSCYTDFDLEFEHVDENNCFTLSYNSLYKKVFTKSSGSYICNNFKLDNIYDKLYNDLQFIRYDGRLVIGAFVHMYPPLHNAGAEHMLHAILKDFAARGHVCKVVISGGYYGYRYNKEPYVVDGVSVVFDDLKHLDDCELVITHLDRTIDAERLTYFRDIPLVHLLHNHLTLKYNNVKKADFIIYNTFWLQEAVKWNSPYCVVHPPVWEKDYLVENEGKYITLVNLIPEKGSNIFYGLAEAFPKYDFLGVIGGYNGKSGKQDIRQYKNVTIMDNQEDMREVYKKTKLLLMPSSYESYGRCAVEAACNGIPCIANGTDGLKEALGDSGTFPKSLTLNDWKNAINNIDIKEKGYQARKHFESLNPYKELDILEYYLYKITGRI